MSEPQPEIPATFWGRIDQTFGPTGMPSDDRGRMRMVVDNLVLHLHPTKVPVRTLRWTYTWGLGGLSALLMHGAGGHRRLSEMNYTPSPTQAYLDILALQHQYLVWRTCCATSITGRPTCWSSRPCCTCCGSSSPAAIACPATQLDRRRWRCCCWSLRANFTGYLLPWDQLAYWAITVGTSILTYIPLIGEWLSRLLLGGPEVAAATLLNFYALHISFIPWRSCVLMSFHFWRVRKDGGLTMPWRPARWASPRANA